METDETMILRDLPVNTRNYTIIDNITGKPIDQSTYSLTIDPEVISKLNKLKSVNEEKLKQSALKDKYSDTTIVETFTPKDNSVFTPVYEGEYIDYRDFNDENNPETTLDSSNQEVSMSARDSAAAFMGGEPLPEEEVEEKREAVFTPTETFQSDTVLERVVARDPSTIVEEAPVETEENPESVELGKIEPETIAVENTELTQQDNSTFTPEMAGLQQASEQIVNIDAEKLGPAIKPPKERKSGTEKIKLDKMEIREGKGFAWLAYILFFLPLLFKGKNRFVRLHANEGLELNIMEIFGALLLLPHFLLTNLTGTIQTVVTLASVLGLVILCACALTIIPMILTAMMGIQFQIPWLWKKRMIHVKEERE